jgi:hypothetical protein
MMFRAEDFFFKQFFFGCGERERERKKLLGAGL